MTVIGFFSRQALHARLGRKGQATTLFLVVSGTLLTMVFASVAMNHHSRETVATADAFDSIALSAAT